MIGLAAVAAEYDLGARGRLSMETPDGWSVQIRAVVRPDGVQVGYEILMATGPDRNAKMMVSLAFVQKGPPTIERVRRGVLASTEEYIVKSVERKQTLQDFSLKQGFGVYCVFTDASLVGKPPKKDDQKVLGSGVVQLRDDVTGVVTLLADAADGGEFRAMVKSVNSLRLTAKPEK